MASWVSSKAGASLDFAKPENEFFTLGSLGKPIWGLNAGLGPRKGCFLDTNMCFFTQMHVQAGSSSQVGYRPRTSVHLQRLVCVCVKKQHCLCVKNNFLGEPQEANMGPECRSGAQKRCFFIHKNVFFYTNTPPGGFQLSGRLQSPPVP